MFPSDWRLIGGTGQAQFYEAAPGVVVAAPHPGCVDDEANARCNLAFLLEHFGKTDAPGIVLVLMDRMVSQDKAARRIWADTDPALVCATGLVGGSLLGRAIASFFLGLVRPRIPIRVFATVDEGLEWAQLQRSWLAS